MTATTVPGYSCSVRSSQATDSASRWFVGSSSSSRSGLDSSSRQRATRRRSPPESVVTSASPAGGAARPWRSRRCARGPRHRRRRSCPAVGLLGQQVVEVGIGLAHGGADLVEAVDQGLGLAHAVGDVAEDVLGRVELRLLGEEPDGEAGGQARLAGEAVVDASHDPEQGRLARPVRADDADLRAGVERQVDAP